MIEDLQKNFDQKQRKKVELENELDKKTQAIESVRVILEELEDKIKDLEVQKQEILQSIDNAMTERDLLSLQVIKKKDQIRL